MNMKHSEIKVGREYVVKLKSSATALRVKVLKVRRECRSMNVSRWTYVYDCVEPSGYPVVCEARAFLREIELTQEQKMNALVAFVDGNLDSVLPSIETLNSPVDVGAAHVSEFRLRQEYQRLHADGSAAAVAERPVWSKPTVVGFTEDGLPLTAEAVSKTLVKTCDVTRGDTRFVVSRPETPAERVARVHAEAMARS